MHKKINQQKRTTRDALAYVAEVKRDRSMFATPSKSSIFNYESNLQEVDDLDASQIDEDKLQLREEKLMELLQKSEIKK